jgi:hypothetical protein
VLRSPVTSATASAESRVSRAGEYNYEHYRTGHFLTDAWRLLRGEGVPPGHEAPDFELDSTEGGQVRLSALRGSLVVLRFVSFT